jgi:hypothetical protein
MYCTNRDPTAFGVSPELIHKSDDNGHDHVEHCFPDPRETNK